MAWTSGVHGLSTAAAFASSHPAVAAHAQLDSMMLFGFVSAFATGASYFYRYRSRAAMLTFAVSLAATGAYGVFEGAWPLGVLELAWATKAAWRGLQRKLGRRRQPLFAPDLENRQARYRDVFGLN
jgi:hypothetical protein